MPPIATRVRNHLAQLKKTLLNRPLHLGRLGSKSWVLRPYRLEGARFIEIGSNSLISHGSNICAISAYEEDTFSPRIIIGDHVYIGHHAFLTAIDEIQLGEGCVLSEHVYITDFFHGFDPHEGHIMEQSLRSNGKVRIGANCFLGYRVAVMPNVSLGKWCIVGANSVVTHSFPAYSMIAGAPARLIKVYSHELRRWVKPDPHISSGDQVD